ncbi:MAG: hypothetical protein ABJL67_07610 [Sulfitobacter sp.]
MRLICGLFLSLWAAGAVVAQEQISPDEFLRRAGHNTLTFSTFPGEEPVGVEQFLPRQRTVWARSDGRCTYGQITLEGPYVCFRYEDDSHQTHCWVPYVFEDRLFVRAENGAVQQVSRITQEPVQCSDALLSSG